VATKARGAKATQAREAFGRTEAVGHVAKPTVMDELTELDRQVENLRLLLAAKLLEQNKQLRRMLERYGDW
jgi:hypothetical protein